MPYYKSMGFGMCTAGDNIYLIGGSVYANGVIIWNDTALKSWGNFYSGKTYYNSRSEYYDGNFYVVGGGGWQTKYTGDEIVQISATDGSQLLYDHLALKKGEMATPIVGYNLYVIGGMLEDSTASGTVEVYPLKHFIDVPPGSNHEASIYAIYNAGIATGCSQNPLRFCPQDPVTRAQMAAFIIRALEGEPSDNYCDNGSPFPDVYLSLRVCKYIKRLSELEITTGYPDGTYRPYNTVTRAQMAAFIIRALEGEPPTDYCATGSPFPDVSANSPTCKYIKRFFELGITTGYTDGTYRPGNNVIRRQMAAFLDKAFLQMD
jgi:hypothetical protein